MTHGINEAKLTSMTRRSFLSAVAAIGATQLVGCGDGASEPADIAVEADNLDASVDTSTDAADAVGSSGETVSGKQILVAYFSRADENYADGGTEWLEVGHTKVMAGYIAEVLGADQYEIVPAEPYPEGYDDCCDQALDEQASDVRPAIADDLPDVSDYGAVFVGAPVWWGEEPMIVRTFLEAVDLSGKVLVPFTTHGGSGLGSLPQSLASRVPSAQVLDGLAVTGTEVDDARDKIASWAQGLALN